MLFWLISLDLVKSHHLFLLYLGGGLCKGSLHFGLLFFLQELRLSFDDHRLLDPTEVVLPDDGGILLLTLDCLISDGV